jgi:hypothetical protein
VPRQDSRRHKQEQNGFWIHFSCNTPVEQRPESRHPSDVWARDARQAGHTPKVQLRLAAMAAHLRVDRIAARQATLIDLLADGRPDGMKNL